MKPSAGPSGAFPENGYARLTDLKDPYFAHAHKEIATLEQAADYAVLRHWNRRWEYPFFMRCAQGLPSGSEVLDAGAGRSLLPFWLAKHGYHVVALDMDDGSFYPGGSLKAWYDERNPRVEGQVNFVHGNLLHMDLPDESFDLVCCMSVLEHVPDPISALRELLRVLRHSGLLILTMDVSLDAARPLLQSQFQEMKECLDADGSALYPARQLDAGSVTTLWFKKNEPSALPWNKSERTLRQRVRALAHGDIKGARKWDEPFDPLAVAGLAYRRK